MLRLAVAQPPAELNGSRARIGWLAGQLPTIRDNGADLVLLPELFACGYNIDAALADRAQSIDGPDAQAIAQLAQTHGIAIHYGMAEKDGDRLFNTALCFGPNGSLRLHQRKLAIPPGFERDHFTPGAGCALFKLGGITIATLICYDAEFPETMRHVAGLGAQLVLVPTALGAQWDWVSTKMIPTRAYENGVYLAYANSAGTENGLTYLGKSVIAAPDGAEAARAGHAPQVIWADIDTARVTAAQARLPYLQDCQTLAL